MKLLSPGRVDRYDSPLAQGVMWVGWACPVTSRHAARLPRPCEWLWVCSAESYLEACALLERRAPARKWWQSVRLAGTGPGELNAPPVYQRHEVEE